MQTICPHCKTVFKVSDEHLKVAEGYVRCGICKEVFNALEKDQPAAPKDPVADSALAQPTESPVEQSLIADNAAPNAAAAAAEATPEQSSKDVAEKPLITPQPIIQQTVSPQPINRAKETPVKAAAQPVDIAQADMFAAPSKTSASGLKPAHAAEAEKMGAINSAADFSAKPPRPEKPDEQASAGKATNNAPGQPAAIVAPKAARPTASTVTTAVTKNITYEINEASGNSLFDGVQSKLIPDEYRIPELHNTYSIWQDIAWSLAILALTASLFAEYTWFNRNELISNPQLRPLVTQLCVIANCNAMALRKPAEIEMTTRNIYSHPNVRNALMVSGTLLNHAEFEQPYPNILIDFSDVRGEVIASRVFTPEDYLQIKATSLRPLPPRLPINFNMEIQDPGNNAMTYEFSFL
jgi:predicted Zn finger-like uncharacterized protein